MSVEPSDVILIADDNQTNLIVLFDFLTEAGFQVLVARNGKSAIQKAEYSQPDLILLDVLMPGLTGFETCERLKASELTQDIPVIFMTALTDAEDKVTGLSLGAVDYITKPIQNTEVLARIKNHLKIRRLTKQLTAQNERLQTEVIERQKAEFALKTLADELERRVEARTAELQIANERLTQEVKERQQAQEDLQKFLKDLQVAQTQLVQSEKMSALGQMVAGIAHEINNPVNFIYGNLCHVREYTTDLLKVVELYQHYYPTPAEEIKEEIEVVDLEFIQADLPKMLVSMQVGADRIREIIKSLRYFSRQEGPEVQSVNIHEGIDSTLMILQNRLKFKPDRPTIEVIKNYSSTLQTVECYGGELNQVFMNILANAIDALDEYRNQEDSSKKNLQIRIQTEESDRNTAIVRIADNGPGMTEAVRSCIFDPFFTTKPTGKGTGIGLSISWQIIVEKHGGILECASAPGAGTEFTIEIPLQQEAAILAASA